MNEDTTSLQTGDYAIEARGLVKVFGNERAVDGVDLTIRKGTVYGFLGPNGAGKTTTIRILATLLPADAGNAWIFGNDLKTDSAAIRKRISLTGQYASIDEDLTGMENLMLIARLMGYSRRQAKTRAQELLLAFGLGHAAKRQVKNYSGGMRRRIDIAASIVVTPDLLFLDEPTTGLDPRSRNQVWDIIRTLVRAGTTVLLTTQYLEEADQLADKIGVIQHGKIIAEGTSSELKASVGRGTLNVQLAHADDQQRAWSILENLLGAPIHLGADSTSLTAQADDSALVAKVLSEFARQHIELSDLSLGRPSLDEVFLKLTGQVSEQQQDSGRDIL
ncbi:ATP-binding cassette domain-containing protein [Planococcus sp. CPCC 101016]|uniref:ATP-binding cassette domain-containing protein n=1 Tax=Planococcus sp. CPCC 101016 TaxID=2599617 RepID=UPI0011B549B5|nr:ATP-binding cassette domain-containing protein [Planococcus sp. CPCC 101016]TWT07852.1 ATP-binding cassette domain-containing protein [Planococcus sp. CPCC 101016]